MAWARLWLLAWVFALVAPAHGQALQPVPELKARVMDLTATLDPATRERIEGKLAAFEKERGTQVVVVMVATTAPEDIADYTQRLGDAWKIGRREVGDGVLFVVALNDRRLRIAPAKALEGALPDLLAKRIIDQAVTPAFRQGDFGRGIDAGVDAILAAAGAAGVRPAADGGAEWAAVAAGSVLVAVATSVGAARPAGGDDDHAQTPSPTLEAPLDRSGPEPSLGGRRRCRTAARPCAGK